jgi:hypothetical protein
MNRRDLFTGLTGYSLVVMADQLPSAEGGPKPTERDFTRIAPPENRRKKAAAEPNMTLVDLDCDLMVAGGGLAGVCAAVTAARHGAKVVLINDRSRLGGNSSSEVKMHVVGASCHKGRPGWREGGLLEEFRLDDAVNNPQRCWEMWDLLLYDKVVSEPNITLLLDTALYSAVTKSGKITQVMCRSDRTEHLYRVNAKLFIDATGDSRLSLEAGAEMRWGREPRSEFGESLAPEKGDGETLGSSLLFTSRLHPRPMPFRAPKWARKVTKEHLKFRKINSWEYGYWWIEWGGDISTIRDNERIRFELLSIVMGVWDYIKNSGNHTDSANYALDWIGFMPGKRGSRRVLGDYMITEHDLRKGKFADEVAIGGWPMDDHPPGGFDRPDLPPNTSIKPDQVYPIPLRSLYSKNVSNLLLAGRNISASHVAFTSSRVMATCAVIGQAAGLAAVQCLETSKTPRQLAQDAAGVKRLQQRLLRDDQSLRDVRNEDPLDLARQAKVTASSEREGKQAELVINGWTRDIPANKALGTGFVGNAWEGEVGATLDLAWDKPRRIREVQFTFDSGFQRELTLTSNDSVNRGIVRAPQPETVRDYRVFYRKAGSRDWVEWKRVTGNHQRLNRHTFDALEVDAIRLQVDATNGHDYARVFEVRCYS